VTLTRLVISQRERTVALRPVDGGLVAHELNEERDLNSSTALFEHIQRVQVDPKILAFAVQLVDRQTGKYDPSKLEDQLRRACGR
jgi:DNA end-binding protein Ku